MIKNYIDSRNDIRKYVSDRMKMMDKSICRCDHESMLSKISNNFKALLDQKDFSYGDAIDDYEITDKEWQNCCDDLWA